MSHWVALFGNPKNRRILDALKRMKSPDDFSKTAFSEADRQQLFKLREQIIHAIEQGRQEQGEME